MNTENIQDIYPLAPMQQGMLFHSIYSSESAVYVEQMSCKLNGLLNLDAFKAAWQKVLDRNPILRTSFVWEGLDEPVQIVHKHVKMPIEVDDLRMLSPQEQERHTKAFMKLERERGFALNRAPLMRLGLFRLSKEEYYFTWTHHHILFDGWSLPLILQELFAFYTAFDENQSIQLPVRRPFRDYIQWLQKKDIQKAKAFWEQYLQGITAPTTLAIDRHRQVQTVGQDSDYKIERILLSDNESEILRQFAQTEQLTLNTLFQAAWSLVLSTYSGSDEVVFGATVSGRPPELSGADQMIGLFINTLPVRVSATAFQAVRNWLQELQLKTAQSRQFEYSSLPQIQNWSDVPQGLPLFENILVVENYPTPDSVGNQTQRLRIESFDFYARTNYPLTLVFSPGKQIAIEIAYETARFSDDSIHSLLSGIRAALQQIVDRVDKKLSHISILPEKMVKKILVEWNATDAPFPEDKCIHELFEQTVEKFPSRNAVFHNEQFLTYSMLNQKANQIATYLQELGVEPEELVGICLDRSFDMITSLLGVLKAGAAYVPMDPSYSKERMDYIIKDSGLNVLISSRSLKNHLNTDGLQLLYLDELEEVLQTKSTSNIATKVLPQNLAYIIYTSGSTGQPKGTLMQHRGLCNIVQTMIQDFAVTPDSRVLQSASFSFDASVAEIFLALIGGATLYLINRNELIDIDKLYEFLQKNQITTVTLPPSLLGNLPNENLPNLQTVVSVGEACSWEIVERWAPNRRFLNGYGPTEATIGTTWQRLEKRIDCLTPPIGRPIHNSRVYILNANLNPVPVGVEGQIFIHSVGLSRGYLNRPDLTASKFMPDPFNDKPGARMYASGDLGRFLPDGSIEFVGRIDHQVKIRGFRIELGEIEANLRHFPSIKDAVVIARDDNSHERSLVGYFVAKEGNPVDIDKLNAFLRNYLPDYMIPSSYVEMDSFPLTPNGKIDRNALPAPDKSRAELGNKFVAPRSPLEEMLVSMFQDILSVDRVGIYDNFFNLGGHSLKATQLLSRIREAFQIEIPLQSVFESPTVAAIAELIEKYQKEQEGIEIPPIKPINRDGELPLSFAQQRLWFLDQLAPESAFYNIPVALRLKGNLDVDALQKSINYLIKRHETLRTIFKSVDGKPHQIILQELSLDLNFQDLSSLDDSDKESIVHQLAREEARSSFNLSVGPLLRAKLLRLAENEHVILFTMHHIISDGWSVNILISEIADLYLAYSQGREPVLPPLKIQYADFAYWQREWLKGDVRKKQLDYWKERLAGSPPMLELPTDRPRPAVQTFEGATVSKTFPRELLEALKELSRNEGVTLFMTLLSAFYALLYKYTGQTDINVGTPIANRNRFEIEKLIGFFVNTLVLRGDLSGNPTFLQLIEQVKEITLGAYAHQDIPFEMLVEELQPDRDLSHTPLFQVIFLLQNATLSSLNLPGLELRPIETDSGSTKFDLSFIVAESNAGLSVGVEYNTQLFDASTIYKLLTHYQMLLTTMIHDPETRLSEVSMLSKEEKAQLLVQWNDTAKPFPDNICAHQLFERIVEKHADAVAATFQGNSLTYSELNEKANQLARYLLRQGIDKEALIGVSVDRSFEMLIGIFGILKAGAAFVPIDPTYPTERIQYMLEDSGIKVLLTQKMLLENLPAFRGETICLDDDWEVIEKERRDNLNLDILHNNLAYVIYTSGSTGRPKGTLLQHQGLCNLVTEQIESFKVGQGSRILQFSSLSFDASVWETIMALLSGATLCLAPKEHISTGQGLLKVLEDESITTVTLPPSVLAVIPYKELPTLKTIITAGEKCTNDLVERWAPGRQFFNAYGPTETTVCASMHLCQGSYPQGPPIGKPIANTRLYILDQFLNPVPVGVPGELYINGVSLARGYLNRPEMTAEKFIPNPFSGITGDRMYKTGDLVRYLPDGDIEFLGRIDHQVKVRGFRIELGEIESVLSEHPDLQDVVVLAREDLPGDVRLVAYMACQNGATPQIGEIRAYLRERLPEYMVPAYFIFMDAMPLSPSGKIDPKALPAPDSSRPELEVEFVPPRNETEKKLSEICATLLGVEQVGVYDNFFDLGGHSLLATQFISRVKESFQVELPLRTLFEKPTVAELAEEIENTAKRTDESIPSIKAISRSNRRVRLSQLKQNKDKSSS